MNRRAGAARRPGQTAARADRARRSHVDDLLGTSWHGQDDARQNHRPHDQADFIEFSAVLAGIKEIKQVMSDADRARQYGTRTIVFVDEIHRFNKAQQDAFLPHVEKAAFG